MSQKEILDYIFRRREELERMHRKSDSKKDRFEYACRWKELGLLLSLITNGVQK